MKICIAGASGFVGTHLVRYLKDLGYEVLCLVRQEQMGCLYWNPEKKHIDYSKLNGQEVFINLCGESILGRWTQQKIQRIRKSRFDAAAFLSQICLKLDPKPKLYIGASAVGYYGEQNGRPLIEEDRSGHGYLAEICRMWEGLSDPLKKAQMRVVHARFGIVLGDKGGALEKMAKPFRLGLGGRLGKGDQMMSWIAIDDLCKAIVHIINQPTLEGAVNIVSPNPVTNASFTQTLGALLHKKTPLPIPRFVLTLFFGSGADIFLSSKNVVPKRLLETGFQFDFPFLDAALKKYLQIFS